LSAYWVSAEFVEYGHDPVDDVLPASPSSTCSTFAATSAVFAATPDHVAVVSVHGAVTRRASIDTSLA